MIKPLKVRKLIHYSQVSVNKYIVRVLIFKVKLVYSWSQYMDDASITIYSC
jgi:hypothetical protein